MKEHVTKRDYTVRGGTLFADLGLPNPEERLKRNRYRCHIKQPVFQKKTGQSLELKRQTL
jgi:hypothetical protein